MAIIKLGGLAQDVRGSLNGTTFSRNKGGAYVRSKVSPVQPVSEFSSKARAIFAALSQRWATALTSAQRSAWVAFASTHTFVNVFGDAITLSGLNMYQSVNRAIMQVGKPLIDDPPSVFSAPAVMTCVPLPLSTAGVIATLAQTTVVSDALGAEQSLYVFATVPLPLGRTPQKNDFRLINPFTFSSIGLTTSFAVAYNSRFDTPGVIVGQTIWFRVAVLDWSTGAIGVGLTVPATIAETP